MSGQARRDVGSQIVRKLIGKLGKFFPAARQFNLGPSVRGIGYGQTQDSVGWSRWSE